MLPLSLSLKHTATFEGPGMFRFDFKECDFESRFYTFNDTPNSLERVLDALKRSGLLVKGAYKWLEGYFGPIIIENIQVSDFTKINSLELDSILCGLVDRATDKYYNLVYHQGEPDIVKRRIRNALEFIPIDTVSFFQYSIEINKTNIGNIKLAEHNLFDYFYFMLGFNETKFYLVTLFFD